MGARTDAQQWTDFPTLIDMEFDAKVARYTEITESIAVLDAERKSLGEDIEAALIVADQKRVRYGDHHCVERCNGGTASKISSQLLATNGVSADVINAATVPGKKYTYVAVIDLDKQSQGKGVPTTDAVDE